MLIPDRYRSLYCKNRLYLKGCIYMNKTTKYRMVIRLKGLSAFLCVLLALNPLAAGPVSAKEARESHLAPVSRLSGLSAVLSGREIKDIVMIEYLTGAAVRSGQLDPMRELRDLNASDMGIDLSSERTNIIMRFGSAVTSAGGGCRVIPCFIIKEGKRRDYWCVYSPESITAAHGPEISVVTDHQMKVSGTLERLIESRKDALLEKAVRRAVESERAHDEKIRNAIARGHYISVVSDKSFDRYLEGEDPFGPPEEGFLPVYLIISFLDRISKSFSRDFQEMVDSGQLMIINGKGTDERLQTPHSGGRGIYLPSDRKYLNDDTIVHEVFAKAGFPHDECAAFAQIYHKYKECMTDRHIDTAEGFDPVFYSRLTVKEKVLISKTLGYPGFPEQIDPGIRDYSESPENAGPFYKLSKDISPQKLAAFRIDGQQREKMIPVSQAMVRSAIEKLKVLKKHRLAEHVKDLVEKEDVYFVPPDLLPEGVSAMSSRDEGRPFVVISEALTGRDGAASASFEAVLVWCAANLLGYPEEEVDSLENIFKGFNRVRHVLTKEEIARTRELLNSLNGLYKFASRTDVSDKFALLSLRSIAYELNSYVRKDLMEKNSGNAVGVITASVTMGAVMIPETVVGEQTARQQEKYDAYAWNRAYNLAEVDLVNGVFMPLTAYSQMAIEGDEKYREKLREILREDSRTFKRLGNVIQLLESMLETGTVVMYVDASAAGSPGVLLVDVVNTLTEERLLREERDRMLLHNTPDNIFRLSPEGRIKYANRQFMQRSAEDLRGTNIDEALYGYGNRRKVASLLAQALAHKVPVSGEILSDGPSGDKSYKVTFVPSGFDELLVVFSDITDSKKAEELIRSKNQYLNKVISESADGIVVLDKNFKVVFESPPSGKHITKKLFGGDDWIKLLHPDDRERVLSEARLLQQDEIERIDMDFRLKGLDGNWHYLNVKARNMLSDPVMEGIVVNYRDITLEREQAEEQTILKDISFALSSEEDEETAMERVLDNLIRIEGIESGGIYFFDEKAGKFRMVAAKGISREFREAVAELDPGEHDFEPLIHGRAVAGNIDLYKDDPLYAQVKKEGFKSLANIPVVKEGKLFSVVILASSAEGAFGKVVMRKVKRLSDELTKALLLKHEGDLRRRAEDRYKTLVEASDRPILQVNAGGEFLFMNAPAAEYFSSTPEELTGKTMWDLFPEDIAERQMDNVRKCISSGEKMNRISKTVINGQVRWYKTVLYPVKEGRNQSVSALVLLQDITVQKEAEEKLRESENRKAEALTLLNTVMDSMPSPVFYKDPGGRYLGCNSAFEKFTGKKREEILGKTVFDLWDRRLAQVYYEADAELISNRGKQVYEGKVMTPAGEERDVVFYKAVFNSPEGTEGLVGVIVDRTEEKRMIDRIRESEERFRSLFEGMPNGALLARADMDAGEVVFSDANPEICSMLGYSKDELLSLGISDIHPWEAMEEVAKHFSNVSENKINYAREIPVKRKDGTIFFADINSAVIYVKGEKYIVGIFQDVSERKEAAEKLKQQRSRIAEKETVSDILEDREEAILREIDRSSLGVMIADGAGNSVYANRSFRDIMKEYKEYREDITPGYSLFEDGNIGKTIREALIKGTAAMIEGYAGNRDVTMQVIPVGLGAERPAGYMIQLYHSGRQTEYSRGEDYPGIEKAISSGALDLLPVKKKAFELQMLSAEKVALVYGDMEKGVRELRRTGFKGEIRHAAGRDELEAMSKSGELAEVDIIVNTTGDDIRKILANMDLK
ncbi:MAG: PAS domain S-box protein, partial [Candidatus Omnitrophica bacterium]|nr:PAS domain S-box protein [Candidatus Omnitrophota bacterium]